eukprot:scaffold27078_cov77-Skeletonema_dohrnii-CCMP3373.AAC.3
MTTQWASHQGALVDQYLRPLLPNTAIRCARSNCCSSSSCFLAADASSPAPRRDDQQEDPAFHSTITCSLHTSISLPTTTRGRQRQFNSYSKCELRYISYSCQPVPAFTCMLVADDADVLVYVDGAELVDDVQYERYRSPIRRRSPLRTDEEVAQPDPDNTVPS